MAVSLVNCIKPPKPPQAPCATVQNKVPVGRLGGSQREPAPPQRTTIFVPFTYFRYAPFVVYLTSQFDGQSAGSLNSPE